MKLETWQIVALIGLAGAAYWYFTRSKAPVSTTAGSSANSMAPSVVNAGGALMYSIPVGQQSGVLAPMTPQTPGYGVYAPIS